MAAGRVIFDQELLQRATERRRGSVPAAAKAFTETERQVLRRVLDGRSNKEIADRLCASESAVKGLLQQLFAKTGVRTRRQLVRVVLALGLATALSSPVAARACTIAVLTDGERVLFCNNEDWSNPNTRIWFIPGEGGRGCATSPRSWWRPSAEWSKA